MGSMRDSSKQRSLIGSVLATILSARHDPAARILNVDLIAVLVAALLPWSTSGVAIVVPIWLVALIPTLNLRPFMRSLRRPACVLPVGLFVLAAVGGPMGCAAVRDQPDRETTDTSLAALSF
jgi:O-antigen ligase